MTLDKLGDVTYIALETFRKNGEGVVTPLWVIGKAGKLYAWTDGESWKVKRIRNNNQVKVCESDARGNPKSEWLDAEATILDDAQTEAEIQQQIRAKYGIQFWLISVINKFTKRGGTRRVVIEMGV
ncbi:MAG: PPOX class F420-dependent oxidoreductase, partial [Chloroflexota bacterium]